MASEGDLVLDSFAWVEYFRDSPLGREVDRQLRRSRCATPTIVLAELADKYTREGIPDLARDLDFIEARTTVVSLDRALAEEGGRLKTEMRATDPDVPLADAIVYATARRLRAEVLTGDPHFRGRRGVVYLGGP